MNAPAYLIANENSGGAVTFRRLDSTGWTDDLSAARRWPTPAAALRALDKIEADRDRAGRRFLVEEITSHGEPAHRELTVNEIVAANQLRRFARPRRQQ